MLNQYTVGFSSYQLAIQACLEVLGTTVSPTPVIMPITSTPDVLSGVLRAGGHACLLDIDPGSLLVDESSLDECLGELDAAILLTDMPVGKHLQDARGMPHVVVTKELPLTEPEALGDFTVYDLSSIGGGALVVSKYQEQLNDLKLVRSGVLGLGADMPSSMEQAINAYVDNYDLDQTAWRRARNSDEFRRELELSSRLELAITPDFINNYELEPGVVPCSRFLMRVPNLHLVLAKLKYSKTTQAIYPLHFIKEVRTRWSTTPSYPNAEMLANTVLALDVHSAAKASLIKKILEII